MRTLKPVAAHRARSRAAVPAAVHRADDAESGGACDRCRRETDRVAYGEYLTNAAVCADCHTPIDDMGTPLPGRDFAGGTEFKLPDGGIVRQPNITPDADTGIGTWTEQQFVDKFKALETAPSRGR